jgi:general secretion pathway protein H
VAVAIRSPRIGRESGGFTLVEVLVTLVVIGIAIGLASLTFGHDPAAQLRREADRLRSALEHAAQIAQWRRDDIVWQADGTTYRFLRPGTDGSWAPESEESLVPHTLPAEVRIRAIGPAGDPIAPFVRLRASGRNDPYTLVLESPAASWTVRADPLNRVFAAITP